MEAVPSPSLLTRTTWRPLSFFHPSQLGWTSTPGGSPSLCQADGAEAEATST